MTDSDLDVRPSPSGTAAHQRLSAEAQRRLGLLEKHFRQSGQCASVPEFGEGAIRGKTSYEGEILARAVGRYLVLMVNPAGSSDELFREALTRLK